MVETFDVICIGAGPAGEAVSNELAGSGLTLAVVEKALVGGECAYYGCIPSKTLLRAADVIAEAGRAKDLSASRVEWQVDFAKVHERVRLMTRDLDDTAAAAAITAQGARLFRGDGELTGPRSVTVGDHRLHATRAIVIATGTAPSAPAIPGLDAVPYWTNRDAVHTPELPSSLIVVGGGAVGVELGQAFARLGTKVTVLELGNQILQAEEPEAGAFLAQRLAAEGLDVRAGVSIEHIDQTERGIEVSLGDGIRLVATRLLIAAGRRPNTDGIDMEAAGLKKSPRGIIQVDPKTLQAADGIYAIGDINGLGGFTHLSHYHGTLVGRALRGVPVAADHSAVPRVTFTDPEIASVGVTERQARAGGLRVEVATADVASTARGYIHGAPGGIIKLVADADRGILVGATIVSPHAGEMLSEVTLAVKLRVPIGVLTDTLHPFPTFSRVFQALFDELDKKLTIGRPAAVA